MIETVYCVALVVVSIACFSIGYLIGEHNGKIDRRMEEEFEKSKAEFMEILKEFKQ